MEINLNMFFYYLHRRILLNCSALTLHIALRQCFCVYHLFDDIITNKNMNNTLSEINE